MGIQERREREREARRGSILDATRALLVERGFIGTTTRQIAERCELSEAALFWYFTSKDEILVSLLLESIDFIAAGLDQIIEGGGGPRQKLEQLWAFFDEVRSQHPEYFHVFAYLAQPQAAVAVDEEVKKEIARRSRGNFRRLAELVGEAYPDQDAHVVADLVWGAFLGLTVLCDSRRNIGAKPHPAGRDLEVALSLMLDGIASSKGGKI